jgi:hypothetical protein
VVESSQTEIKCEGSGPDSRAAEYPLFWDVRLLSLVSSFNVFKGSQFLHRQSQDSLTLKMKALHRKSLAQQHSNTSLKV